MDIILKLKEELNVEKWQVEAAVKLIDEGNTIPGLRHLLKPKSLQAAEMRYFFVKFSQNICCVALCFML